MNPLFPTILVSVITLVACAPASKPRASVTVKHLSGSPLVGAKVMLGRDSAVPVQGKLDSDGKIEHEQLAGDGRLIVSHGGVTIYKTMKKPDWPCRLTWPVPTNGPAQGNVKHIGIVTVRRSDKSPVPNLKVSIGPAGVDVPVVKFKPLPMADGTTVAVNADGPLRLAFDNDSITVLLKLPECSVDGSFEVIWPE